MSRTNSKHRKPSAEKQGNGAWSTLGDQLRLKNPEVVKQFERIQSRDMSADRLVNILFDLFPYSWKDPESFADGLRLNLKGEHEDAIRLFEEVLRHDPEAYPALHLLGYFHGCLGNCKEEVECYKKAIKIRPDYPQIYLNLGVAYWLLGKEKKALFAFKQAIPMAPEFQLVDFWFTLSFDRLGKYRSGNGGTGKGSHIKNHVLAHTCYLMGIAFLELRYHTAARQAFKKAIQIHPDFADAYFQLGALHIKKLRNPKRAAKYLEQAEGLYIEQNNLQQGTLAHQLICSPDQVAEKDRAVEAWLKEGLKLHREGRYQGAIDAYRVAIKLKGKYLEAYYNMGIAYGCLADAGMETIDRAIYAFKDSIRIKPDYVHAYIALGVSYIKGHQLEDAIETLSQATRLKNQDFHVYHYLGVAHRMSRRFVEAVDALKKAIALKSDSVQSHFHMGMALMDLGQCTEACLAFQESIRFKPDFAQGHFMLGRLYYVKLIEIEKALCHLKKAEKLFLKMEDYHQAGQVRQLLMMHPD